MHRVCWLTTIAAVCVLALAGAVWCQSWPVTNVYVKVSQDDAGNFSTTAVPSGYWTGPNATWVRGMIRGEDGDGHPSPWPVGKIVRIGPFHEQDPTRNWDMFYGVPPLGYDAYYMHTSHYWGDPVSKIYVGTNFFTDVKMKDIVTLQYSTQVTYRRHDNELPGYTLWGQPPMIEITTDSGSSLQQRTFLYKPWGLDGRGLGAVQLRWQTWDCLRGGFWERINTSVASIGDWQYQLAYKSTEKKLAAPAVGDYTQGYITPPGLVFHNPSGSSFAIRQGAPRRDYDNYSGNTQYSGKGPWCLESLSCHGFFDKVVIGVADQRDPNSGSVLHETRYTFDFENSTAAVPTLAAMNNAPRKLAVVKALENSNLFVLYGKAILTPDYLDGGYTDDLFTIDDGSGAPVRVICPGHGVQMPDGWSTIYVRAEGRLYNYQGEDSRYRYLSPIPQVHEHLLFSRPDMITVY